MDYYEISEPQYCKETMELYKVHNDPVRDFMSETVPQFGADAIPSKYLYELYRKWLEQNNPAAKRSMLGKTNFLAEFRELLKEFPEWDFLKDPFRARAKYFEKQELTLHIYDMTDWMTDPDAADPDVKYRLKWEAPLMTGILRTKYRDRKRGRPKNEEEDEEKGGYMHAGEVRGSDGELIDVDKV